MITGLSGQLDPILLEPGALITANAGIGIASTAAGNATVTIAVSVGAGAFSDVGSDSQFVGPGEPAYPEASGKQARRIWDKRNFDHPTDPVSIYRIMILLAGCAVASRGGAEAVSLWSWSSGDAATIERVAQLKRWLDPLSVGCGFVWMALHILAEPMIEHQLRKAPLPVDMWSRWPQLRRPALILLVSLLMAAAAVGLR